MLQTVKENMKYIYAALLLSAALVIYLTQTKEAQVKKVSEPKAIESTAPQKISVEEKKERFFALIVPPIEKVHKELMTQYKNVAQDIKNGTNRDKIKELKAIYRVKSNEKLLAALKPHPPSIVLAQAAMESSWATSRFFVEANNIFGMWSVKKNEPRIAALEKRDGTRTIWLKKFASIEDSVRAYYKLMGRGRAYKEFRALRVTTDDPYILVEKLDNYSEIGAAYGEELSQVIKYNNLTKYD